MALERWDPFREAVSLRDAMNALFQDSFVRPSGSTAQGGGVTLPLDISENPNEFVVKASLPGVKPEDVQITVHGDYHAAFGFVKPRRERRGLPEIPPQPDHFQVAIGLDQIGQQFEAPVR